MSYLYQALRHLRAILILFLCLQIGNLINFILPFNFASGILGLIVLFLLLQSKILPSSYIEQECRFIMKFMAILFIPISVGVLEYLEFLQENFLAIVLSTVLSSTLVLIITGFITDKLINKQEITSSVE